MTEPDQRARLPATLRGPATTWQGLRRANLIAVKRLTTGLGIALQRTKNLRAERQLQGSAGHA
ncbi:UNVERIFIED_ORG: hypothetical protein J2Y77_001547 [Pseudomonas lini]|uniref:Uncharacterized protein n=1 Tax=Pseudomonas viciae TaxID=2505979 RepID=A0A4P7PG65_9PSED|nr:hypothetical protein [Pseudomonas viciae]QBZ89586.1 hypothetical protein EPZ47_12965 [Pseudomonas viciae]UZE89048.1 hypothetical protein LOY66_13525 [Pseudomonas viciae]WGO95863.1 hypothetical protein QCD61_12465 [Pseudomonas viciae]